MWFEVKPDETDGSEQDVFKKLCKETKTPGIIAYGSPSPRQCNLLRVSDEGQIIGKYMFLSDRRNDGEYWLSNDDYGCFSIGPVDGPDHGSWPIMGDNLKASFGIARDEKVARGHATQTHLLTPRPHDQQSDRSAKACQADELLGV